MNQQLPKKTLKPLAFLILLGCFLFLLLSSSHFHWRRDGGIALAGTQRLQRGELIYKDFFEFWMPGSFYFLKLIFTWLPATAATLRGLIFIKTLLLYGLVFTLGWQVTGSLLGAALSLLFFVAPTSLPEYNPNWLALVLCCLQALLQINYFKKTSASSHQSFSGKLRFLVFTGLINGLTISFIQWQGAAAYLASSILLLSEKGSRRQERLRQLTIYTFATALIPLGWITFFAQQGILSEFLQSTILFPFTHYPQGNMQQVPSFIWWATTTFYIILVKKLSRNRDAFPRLQVLLVWGLAFHTLSLISPTSGHVALGYAFTAPLITTWLLSLSLSSSTGTPPAQKLLDLLTSKKFLIQGTKRSLLLIFLSFLLGNPLLNLVGQTKYLLRKQTRTVNTVQGNFYATPQWEQTISTINSYLDQQPPNNKYVYFGPWSPSLYFIFPYHNPTRYDHLGPEHYTLSILEEIVSDLETKNVSTVVFLTSESHGYRNEPNLLTAYLEENYHRQVELPVQYLNPEPWPPDAIWVRNE